MRKQARRAAELVTSSNPDDIQELAGLLAAYGNDPYFAHEFAKKTSPRDYGELIRTLTPYEGIVGYMSEDQYATFLDDLAGTVSLASRGTGDLAMPKSWQDEFINLMGMPLPKEGDPPEQNGRDFDNRSALWLLLSRGQWSTDFLKQTTTAFYALDKKGFGLSPGAGHIAISPNGNRFVDPMVALMGALVNNPEAAHWAFTHDGTTEVPFPKDGENATGDVNSFLHHMFADHRFVDEENGPKTVLVAMTAALMWENDPTIVDSAKNLQKSMEQQQQVWDEKSWFEKFGHTVLDVLGLIPFVGEAADAVNAAWYSLEGDWVNAGLSAAALIPFAGGAVGLGKLLGKGSKLADLLKMVDRFGNAIDPASDLAQSLLKGRKVSDGVYRFDNTADLAAILRGKHPNMEFRSRELAFVTDEAGNVSQLRVHVDGQWVDVDSSKLGLELSALKPGDTPWDLIGLPRGEVIESAVATTTYKNFDHVGKLNNGYYPTIDFYKDGRAVSLKTMDPPNAGGVRTIKGNIDKLKQMKDLGRTSDGRPVQRSELDLRIRVGQENSPEVLDLVRYAKSKGVKINVNTY